MVLKDFGFVLQEKRGAAEKRGRQDARDGGWKFCTGRALEIALE